FDQVEGRPRRSCGRRARPGLRLLRTIRRARSRSGHRERGGHVRRPAVSLLRAGQGLLVELGRTSRAAGLVLLFGLAVAGLVACGGNEPPLTEGTPSLFPPTGGPSVSLSPCQSPVRIASTTWLPADL